MVPATVARVAGTPLAVSSSFNNEPCINVVCTVALLTVAAYAATPTFHIIYASANLMPVDIKMAILSLFSFNELTFSLRLAIKIIIAGVRSRNRDSART